MSIQFGRIDDLASAAAAGPGPERDELTELCYDLVRYQINRRGYFPAKGMTRADLVQEGVTGVLDALRYWIPERMRSFSNFALICIDRNLQEALTRAYRVKHRPLNDAVSLDKPAYTDKQGQASTAETRLTTWRLSNPAGRNPLHLLLEAEATQEIRDALGRAAGSEVERVALQRCILQGEPYQIAAAALGCHYKSIDNACQRVRRKLRRMVEQGEISPATAKGASL